MGNRADLKPGQASVPILHWFLTPLQFVEYSTGSIFKDLCSWLITVLCCCLAGGVAQGCTLALLPSRLSLIAGGSSACHWSASHPQGVVCMNVAWLAHGGWQSPGACFCVIHSETTAVLCLSMPGREGQRVGNLHILERPGMLVPCPP